MTQTLTVSNNWLDTDQTVKWSPGDNINTESVKLNHCYQTNGYYYPYLNYWAYTYAPKIQLKLSEIEKLRKVAKEKPELKDILNKFTAYIEVIVDF